MATDPGPSQGDDSRNNLWGMLPSFDPAVDDVREYTQKVKFIHGICPSGQRAMLAPRLAMLCKGTAWNQVRTLSSEKLTNAETGVQTLLEALASWEETDEMVTFEKFERALYRTTQKSDESTMSFTNRLTVAFDDLGDVKIHDFKAFILLRQSNLNTEDKKKILTMTGGKMEAKLIDQSMRSLATRVLTGINEPKKKVYPTNFIEEESHDPTDAFEPAWTASSYVAEEEPDDFEVIEILANQGDADALTIQTFESDLEDLFQSTPDLQNALVSYQEARLKLSEKKKYRGFWPTGRSMYPKGKGKGKFQKGAAKGGSKSSLLERIARTHCKACGERGHWRAECPHRNKDKEAANVAVSTPAIDSTDSDALHVIVESLDDEPSLHSSCFASMHPCLFANVIQGNNGKWGNRDNGDNWKRRAVSFLSQRIQQRKHSTLRESPDVPKPSESCHVHTALSATPDGSFAVLDTGASRSVIGSELVPSLLKDLPASIRQSVKRVPSNIGFRFGNNQVSYSNSQLQIPMVGNRKRIWLLVEVVKGATPFLLSIHAMKCLGAQIDLSANQVYLNVLQRSLNIHENSNGLYMVRLKELCHKHEDTATCTENIFHSQLVSQPQLKEDASSDRSVSSNAQPSRRSANDQSGVGASHGESEGASVSSGIHGRGTQQCPASSAGTLRSYDAAFERGEVAEEQDRRDCTDLETKSSAPSESGGSSCGLRSGMGSGVTNHFCGTIREASQSSSSQHCSGTTTQPECTCDAFTEHSCGNSDRGSESKHRDLGSEMCELGTQMVGHEIPGSVRTGSQLCAVDRRPCQHVDSPDEGLSHVLPEPPALGAPDLNDESGYLVQQDPCSLLSSSFLNSNFEQGMISQTLKEMKPKKQVDLIEVYAEPNSRLAQAVINMGGTALRFTREDGDLGTYDGQCKLLRWIFEYSPKHLWLAPECLPWCAWTRFNKSRSLESWLAIEGKQEESRNHLMFCNLLMKVQKGFDRHTHMENPDASEAWDQPELTELVQGTCRARFDQCQMGLKHPQNHKFIRKRTTVRTTSYEMHRLLDERFCSGVHSHAQIAGSCQIRGKAVPVSRFAAYYPSGLAKRVAKCILKQNHTMVDTPILHIEELETIDDRPSKRSRIVGPHNKEEVVDEESSQN